ncbi:MAG: Spy/CpxP family protein refolding chaperone [Defluviicoccus sp.]|nr:Spy/CpxP family protein refolding chaperone [Defluviicoccus sp.]MDE0275467.1 Spy/CpxP family protein refolding chaperone [Defluviicoccus sp.]
MKRRTVILSVSSLGAVALVAVTLFAAGPGGAFAHGRWASGGGWGGHGAARLCSDSRDAHIDDAIRFVEAFANFTPEQTGSWNALTTAVRNGSAKVGQACETAEAAGRPSQAPQHLARAELALTTALGVLQEVKPAFVDLYGKLNDEQRERIDDLLDRKGRYHRR